MNGKFICPVCKVKYATDEILEHNDKLYFCAKNHTFDISSEGYVNLDNAKSSHSKDSGDNKQMCAARSGFLEKGYYSVFANALSNTAKTLLQGTEGYIADAGCGEGYYLRNMRDNGISSTRLSGIDLARSAVKMAAKREKSRTDQIRYAAASVFDMPYADNSLAAVLSVFAPVSEKEANRTLHDGGYLLVASPGEDHLWEFKGALYDIPYPNSEKAVAYTGFSHIETKRVAFEITLPNVDIQNLFYMTPYCWKSPRETQEKLESLNDLTTKAQFLISVYKKL